MHIEIDTSTATTREVAGLIQLLATASPGALEFMLNPTHAPGDLTLTVNTVGDEPAPEAAFAEPPALDPATAFSAPLAPPPPATSAIAPPPPPAASAPPPPPPPASAVELDVKGLPWDARIHAATKTKNNDGSWKGKRGASADLILSVTTELKALHASGAAPPAAETPPPPPPPPADAAPPPPPAAAPPASPLSEGSPAQRFAAIMRKITDAQGAGKITMAQVTSTILPMVGLTAMRDLMSAPDKMDEFEASLEAYLDAA